MTTPLPYYQHSEQENVSNFYLETILPDNLNSTLTAIFKETAGQWRFLRRQHWIQATVSLLSKADLLEEGATGNPSCHPVLKIGQIYLADAHPDALSTPAQQLNPVACARLIKSGGLDPDNDSIFEIARLLKQRYEHTLNHNSMAHFIYPLADRLLQELNLNPHLPETWDELSDYEMLRTFSCLLCFDVLTSCIVLPNHRLEFSFPHDSSQLDFQCTEIPNELMSYGSPDEEFLVISEPFELATHFSLLSTEQKQQWRDHIHHGTLPSGSIKEMLFRVSDLILQRYLTPYFLARKPHFDSPLLQEAPKNEPQSMTEVVFLQKLQEVFEIGSNTGGGPGNCFLTACIAQLPLLSRMWLGVRASERMRALREAIALYYEEHAEELSSFIPQRCLNSFAQQIRGNGWTGEDVVIHITSLILNRPIFLYNTFSTHHYLDTNGLLKPDKVYNSGSNKQPLYVLGRTHFCPLYPKRNRLTTLLQRLGFKS